MASTSARSSTFSAKPDGEFAASHGHSPIKEKRHGGHGAFHLIREQRGGGPHPVGTGYSRGQKHRVGRQVLQVTGMGIFLCDNQVITCTVHQRMNAEGSFDVKLPLCRRCRCRRWRWQFRKPSRYWRQSRRRLAQRSCRQWLHPPRNPSGERSDWRAWRVARTWRI